MTLCYWNFENDLQSRYLSSWISTFTTVLQISKNPFLRSVMLGWSLYVYGTWFPKIYNEFLLAPLMLKDELKPYQDDVTGCTGRFELCHFCHCGSTTQNSLCWVELLPVPFFCFRIAHSRQTTSKYRLLCKGYHRGAVKNIWQCFSVAKVLL